MRVKKSFVLQNKKVLQPSLFGVLNNPAIFAGDYILAIATHPMMVPALKVTLKKIHSVYYSLNYCLLEARPAASQSINSDDSELLASFTSTDY